MRRHIGAMRELATEALSANQWCIEDPELADWAQWQHETFRADTYPAYWLRALFLAWSAGKLAFFETMRYFPLSLDCYITKDLLSGFALVLYKGMVHHPGFDMYSSAAFMAILHQAFIVYGESVETAENVPQALRAACRRGWWSPRSYPVLCCKDGVKKTYINPFEDVYRMHFNKKAPVPALIAAYD